MDLSSPAFSFGARIPRKFTRDGENLSPALEWRNAPSGTKSFALIVDDPDAPGGTFHHWALYNIPANRHHLPEGFTHGASGEDVGVGLNDFGRTHYDGPQPPHGHGPHHYHFKLLALDVERLAAKPKTRIEEVWRMAKDHVLAQAELVGVYER